MSVKDTLSIRINIFGLSSVLRIYLILMWIPILDPTGKTLIWILDSTGKKESGFWIPLRNNGSGFWIPLGKMIRILDPTGKKWIRILDPTGKKWIRILDPTGKNGSGFWIPLGKMDSDSGSHWKNGSGFKTELSNYFLLFFAYFYAKIDRPFRDPEIFIISIFSIV